MNLGSETKEQEDLKMVKISGRLCERKTKADKKNDALDDMKAVANTDGIQFDVRGGGRA